MVFLLGNSTALSVSRRKRHGSCFRESGLPLKVRLSTNLVEKASMLKLTKPLSAARRGSCTLTNGLKRFTVAAQKERPSLPLFWNVAGRSAQRLLALGAKLT